MMTTENTDLFEVTCEDCGTTKSYFTAQGVGYFKLNHEGHKIRVREPTETQQHAVEEPVAPPRVVQVVEEPLPEVVDTPVEITEETIPEPEEREEVQYVAPAQVLVEDKIRLGNLVVDVVDEGVGKAVKVFGIANGREKFAKAFEAYKIDELNHFLESGLFYDDATKLTYTWTPDKVDLSMDVVKMIDEAPQAPQEAEALEVPKPKQEVQGVPVPPVQAMQAPARVATQSLPEEVLLGKRGYIQEGEEYAREAVRVSGVLRKFRWNTEPPYVIGAMFDDLMCVQSQTGMVKSSLIEEVKKLGYAFVAIEAPSGTVTAWFKKNGQDGEQEVLEFHQPTQ